MKIVEVEPILLQVPFSDGSSGRGLFPSAWTHLDLVLVKVTADNGIVGWGEGFGYFCSHAVASMISTAFRPLLVGVEVSDLFLMNKDLQRCTVLPGRYGITTFALSGVDIALWDLVAKSEHVSVSTLLGARRRDSVKAYASLVRYGDTDLIMGRIERALAEGFGEIKLHEIEMPIIRQALKAIGQSVPVTLDVNCNWSDTFTVETLAELENLGIRWLEEPIFPPEDFRSLARLRTTDVAIAAGENLCTSFQFGEMIRCNAVDFLQPSVTKVGGITEYEMIRRMNEQAQLAVAPHSPYFGPGYLATLQMAAVDERFDEFEYLYVDPVSWLYPDSILPRNGIINIPEGPGLGVEPSMEFIDRYRV